MRPLATGNILINYMIAVYLGMSSKCLGCLAVQLLSQIPPESQPLEELSPVCVAVGELQAQPGTCKVLEKVNK